jgi:hypothetical protein
MGPSRNAATLADEGIEIGLGDSDGASESMSHDRAAMNQPANGVVMKP